MKRLVVYANPTYDVIGGSIRVGGPAYYAVMGARVYGYEVAVYGAVGRDGHRAIVEYRRVGVRFEKLVFNVDEATTRFRIEYEGDRRTLFVEEPGPVLAHVEERRPRIVSPVLGELPRSTLQRLVGGAYLDVQGLVRRRARGVVEYVEGACLWLLEADNKPRAIHGDTGEIRACFAGRVGEAVRRLSREGVELIITMGYRGLLIANGDEVYRVGAWGPKSPDPTGMGDVFLAAYAAGREEGLEPLDAARRAAIACGLRAAGLTPKDEEIEKHEREVRVERVSWDTVGELLG